jgi:hypothetical protein
MPTIETGPQDPLFVANHTGPGGNPAFWFQQDANNSAFIWYGQQNHSLNIGSPTRNPILSINPRNTLCASTITAVAEFDPLLTIDHTGASGNPALWFQQDGQNRAFIWYDQQNDFLNIGTPRRNPIISISRDGSNTAISGAVSATAFNQVSSRETKDNILELSSQEAVEALEQLNPVKFNYKADDDKAMHIGFIAEDVPDYLTDVGRKAVSFTDVVAIVTQVLKEQQKTIKTLGEKCQMLEMTVNGHSRV